MKKYKEGEKGRFVSEKDALANKASTMALTELHPLTRAFENIREGETEKAKKIFKRFGSDDWDAYHRCLLDLITIVEEVKQGE